MFSRRIIALATVAGIVSTVGLIQMNQGSASAQSIQCGVEYVVSPGDTLSAIAERAYGDLTRFDLIFDANANVVGDDPSQISVGDRLIIPCEGDQPAATFQQASVRFVDTIERFDAPGIDRPIRILSGTGWAPLLDQTHERGGMLVDIVDVAFKSVEGQPRYEIDFVANEGTHLNLLRASDSYDLGIGWSRPNCEAIANLKRESVFRCNGLTYSAPIYEETLGYLTRSNVGDYLQHDDLVGSTICRPQGYSLAPMEEVGLTEPKINLLRAQGVAGCVDLLLSGQADAAFVALEPAEARIAQLGVQTRVKFHELLEYRDLLHVVIATDHPQRDQILATVNEGLQKVKDSGDWFRIVRRHRSEHRAKLGSS